MAYIDDRAWCHGKIVGLSDKAFRVWVSGIAYASGMSTLGVLDASQQRLLGSSSRVKSELVDAGLWDELPGKAVSIHDWDEYNGKRDARKAADRERKRQARRSPLSAGHDADSPQDVRRTRAGVSAGIPERRPRAPARRPAPDDGSEGSTTRAVPVSRPPAPAPEDNGKALANDQGNEGSVFVPPTLKDIP